MLAAEGLDFGTSLSWWNRPALAVPPGEGWVRDLAYAGQVRPASVYDAEVEHEWGAVYLIGLRGPVTIEAGGDRSNLPYVKWARQQGALVCYQGGWSREVLIDALLGCVDVVNVCNNNFHRHKFQPRRRYSNLLKVEGFGEYPETPLGMMEMNTETYYRLLNCGLRLAAGAGSATGAKSTPVGYNRAYVGAGEKPTLQGFLQAWRAGRNFVTNGPMLFLTAGRQEPGAGGGEQALGPGDTLDLAGEGGRIHVKAAAMSDQPLRSLEIVVNGQVAHRAVLDGDRESAELSWSAQVSQGSWVAARCTGEDRLLSDEELAEYRLEQGNVEEPCRLRFGHTSPIYVTVAGHGVRIPASVAEARRMLDAFERFARERGGEAYRAEITEALAAARVRLRP